MDKLVIIEKKNDGTETKVEATPITKVKIPVGQYQNYIAKALEIKARDDKK